MVSLIVDSSTKILYISLVLEGVLKYEKYVLGQNDHAKNIVILIEEALKENKMEVANINEVIVGVGPGSYTGVRMAVTVGKMLASLGQIKLKKISTLALMSSGYEGVTLALIDARRGNAFAGGYKNGDLVIEECLVNKESFIHQNLYQNLCDESHFIVDPLLVISKAILVENPHSFVPNYLRDTEAERNLNNDHS